MILVSEVCHPGEAHVEFNSSFLEVARLAKPSDAMIFRAEAEHIIAVKTAVETPVDFEFRSFNKYYDPKQFSWLKRIIGEMREIRRSLWLGKKLGASTFIWTCIFPTGHFFLSICLLLSRKKNIKHVVVLHGELEFLKNASSKKVDYLLALLLKCAIKASKNNLNYIVLGDRIKEHLKAYFNDRLLKRVNPILHPYHYTPINEPFILISKKKILVFGAFGTQKLLKNSNYIFELAQKLQTNIKSADYEFVTIGKVLPEIYPFKNDLVRQIHPDSFVPRQILEHEIRKLNFVLFFYDNKSYQLCASGAVFEAIRMGLPIISIYNDYFDWLFNKYGMMGFLCNDIVEMQHLIQEIGLGKLDDEIAAILKTIQEFKKRNDFTAIAKDLEILL